jgi:NAD(P)-dependent dehydrogenase (short-subunit alcohol dehydrogenase family)
MRSGRLDLCARYCMIYHNAKLLWMTAKLTEFQVGTAVVVGGSGGIGSAICRDLAELGSNVCLTYNTNRQAAEEVVDEVRARGTQAWAERVAAEDPDEMQGFVDGAAERFGELHSVVYASGPPLSMKYIHAIEPAEWARIVDVDVNGCFHLVWASLPHLRRRGTGSLVAVVSAAINRVPKRDILSAAPKAAIEMLMRGVAREEGSSGIRANCVGPGWIDTPLSRRVIDEGPGEEYRRRVVNSVPLKRFGEPEDIAHAVTFLLSNRARFITGEFIAVAGGGQI